MPAQDLIKNSSIAAVVSDPRLPDNPIVACNEAFERLTGYRADEIIGRNCRFLRGSDSEPELAAQLREAIAAARPVMVEIINYRKDGTPFRNAVMVAPLFDESGALEYFLGSQVEVADEGARDTAGPGLRDAARARIDTLTPRQRQILMEMASGKLNKQIAWELGLSERTIKMHRAAMFRELGVRTSAEAIRMAVEAGY
ncbi:PAS domain-containing protein [Novosphingobium sp. FSY-8]|uniref:PAS domain-containing protein n=1 Tax=Novosphingobium ovatum TaxID=1908523 RepID=A0ABW9XI86_9SPHN|nr:PAS domain-containing protein [Novosphingobium ovatum]NBC38168.1 PAS domain-containing protein [Novosphingobium ovatum]